MIIRLMKAILRINLTLLILLIAGTPAESQSNPPVLIKDMQATANRINKKLDSYGPYMSGSEEKTIEPEIISARMLLYYDDAFFKNNSYKKLIIFYFSKDKTRVDEYYPIKNNKLVIRMKLNTAIKPDQVNIESFLHEYEQMKKTILSKYIFVGGVLEVWVGPNAEIKTKIDDSLFKESDILLQRESVAVNSVVMD